MEHLNNGRALPTEKLKLERGEWTLTALRKLLRAALGPRARIWQDGDKWLVGLDTMPGRKSLAFGDSPEDAMEKAFDPFVQEFAPPALTSPQE